MFKMHFVGFYRCMNSFSSDCLYCVDYIFNFSFSYLAHIPIGNQVLFFFTSLNRLAWLNKIALNQGWVREGMICLTTLNQKHVSQESCKLFGPEKPLVKLWLAYSVKLVSSYVVKRIKIKITSKFRASRGLCFDDTKRIMSPEKRPKSFGTFEKGTLAQKWRHWSHHMIQNGG